MNDRVYAALRAHSAAKLVTQAISWLATLYVIRELDSVAFGLFGVASAVFAYASMVYEGSVVEALVQRPPASHDARRSAFTLLMLLGVIATALMLGLALPIAAFVGEPSVAPLIWTMSAGLIATALGVLPQARMMRELRFGRLAVISSIQALAVALVTIGLAYGGAGVWALVGGPLVGSILRTVLLNLSIPGLYAPTTRLGDAVQYLRFGGVLFADNLLWRWYTSIDTFLLARWSGASQLGFYSLAQQVAGLPLEKITTTVNDVALPAYSDIAHDRPRAARLLLETIRTHATVGFPLYWGLAAVAALAVPILFGDKWNDAVFPLIAISIITPVKLMGSIETPAMTGLGRPGVLVRTKLIIAPVMTAAVVTGARVGGVDGVAIAWLVAFPFCYAFAFRLVLNAVGLRFGEMLAVIRGPAAAAAVMVVAVRGWHWLAGDGVLAPSFVLASEIALGAAVYLATLWLLDRNAFDLVRQRLGRVIGLRAAQ